jgi:AcrR family transcriptional regulator
MMSPRPRLDEQIPDLQVAIKEAAWQQIAERGAPSLSLRAVARSLGITAPAIYNYYPRRDDLVTALVVEAFNSLGDALVLADQACNSSNFAERIAQAGYAYRQWALTYPQRYNLIFGTPIPGYHAPMEITQPAAARGLTVLIAILDQAHQAGMLNIAYIEVSNSLLEQIKGWKVAVNSDAHPSAHALALVLWTRVHGVVSIELYHQFPPPISDASALFEMEIATIRKLFQS